MKPNAQQFFDIWCVAVEYAARMIEKPTFETAWKLGFLARISEQYGLDVAQQGLAYAEKLLTDTQQRGTV